MKLICTLENFKKAILNAERIVSRQTTLPILNNILFSAEKGSLNLFATNLEIGVITKITAKVEKEGKITIPAKLLSNFINNLSGQENISLETDGQNLKIKSGTTKASIKGLSAEDFPIIPQKKADFQLQIPSGEIKNIILKILISAAPNETRQELTGINILLGEEKVFFASTDSFRLSECSLEINQKNTNKETYQALREKRESIIVPATVLAETARIISNNNEEGEVKIAIEEGQIFFEINNTKIVSRLINGKYPDYKHIIPTNYKTRAVGEKSLIQNTVKLASVFASNKTSEISVKIDSKNKKAVIGAMSADVGENSSELKLDITGDDQNIILNAKYFLDGLNNITTRQVAILANGEATPIALKEIDEKNGKVLEDYVYIVMPIKN